MNYSYKARITLVVLAGMLLNLILFFHVPDLARRLDLLLYDSFMALSQPENKTSPFKEEKILVLALDKETESAYPEPFVFWKGHFAKMIRSLADAGANAVAFDIIFKAESCHPQMDQEFRSAIVYAQKKGCPIFSGYSIGHQEPHEYNRIFGRNRGFLNYSSKNDIDGVARRFLIRDRAANKISMVYKFLRPEIARVPQKTNQLRLHPDIYIDYRLAQNIPVFSFARSSLSVTDDAFTTRFKDKYIFIGHTTTASKDIFPIPVNVRYGGKSIDSVPGVIIQWAIGKTLLADRLLSEVGLQSLMDGMDLKWTAPKLLGSCLPEKERLLRGGVIFFISILIPMLIFRDFKYRKSKLTPLKILLGILILIFGLVSFSGILFHVYFLVFNTADFLISLFISTALSIVLRYLLYFREKTTVLKEFGSYLKPEIVDRLIYNQQEREELAKGVAKKQISVMFVDIRSFSDICDYYERTGQTRGFVHDLNTYVVEMNRIIQANNGFLNRVIGDGLLVLFGALDNNENTNADRQTKPAQESVCCAIEILEKVKALNREGKIFSSFGKQNGQQNLEVGIGINTGPAILACSGNSFKKEFTAIGSAVNKAARIEGLTKGIVNLNAAPEKQPKKERFSLIVGNETHRCLPPDLALEIGLADYGRQKLKGLKDDTLFVAKKL